MKKSRFSDEQIAYVLRQAEAGTPIAEIVRKRGISEAAFYAWKKKFGSMGTAEIRELRQLREENSTQRTRRRYQPRQDHVSGRELKKMVAPMRWRLVELQREWDGPRHAASRFLSMSAELLDLSRLAQCLQSIDNDV